VNCTILATCRLTHSSPSRALNPESDDAYLELGMMHKKIGEEEKAANAFQEALHINPRMKIVIDQLVSSSTKDL
jgi:predicted TPR repeat methyltransferase